MIAPDPFEDCPVEWPAPAGVQACMTVRGGGDSAAPYDSLNLAMHVGDDALQVMANRKRLNQRLGVQAVFLEQVHGVVVADLGQPVQGPADASLTDRPGLACTVMVADCLPVLLADRQARWVAAAHAGWRGLAGQGGRGVLEALVQSLQERGVSPQDLIAWLGPCIGPQQFEVGPEVRQALCDSLMQAADHFRPSQRERHYMADLPALARQRLQALGVAGVYGNDSTVAWCTVSQSSRFFSHRRDSRLFGGTGRMAALVWLEA